MMTMIMTTTMMVINTAALRGGPHCVAPSHASFGMSCGAYHVFTMVKTTTTQPQHSGHAAQRCRSHQGKYGMGSAALASDVNDLDRDPRARIVKIGSFKILNDPDRIDKIA